MGGLQVRTAFGPMTGLERSFLAKTADWNDSALKCSIRASNRDSYAGRRSSAWPSAHDLRKTTVIVAIAGMPTESRTQSIYQLSRLLDLHLHRSSHRSSLSRCIARILWRHSCITCAR